MPLIPSFQYWISGPAIYLAGSFVFAVVVGLIGIRNMVSDRWFRLFMAAAIVLSFLAWRNAAKQEQDSDHLRSQLTGGDSYCYVMALISNPKDITSNMDLGVVTSDKFPLYDVTFGIRRNPLPTDSDQDRLSRFFTVESHFLGTVLPFGTRLNRSLAPGDYTIEIRARNGSFTERLRLIPIDGEIKQIIQVYRFGTGEQLFATPKVLPPGITR